jgi:hypothetical protein
MLLREWKPLGPLDAAAGLRRSERHQKSKRDTYEVALGVGDD